MECVDLNDRSNSRLQINSICSVRISSRKGDIREKSPTPLTASISVSSKTRKSNFTIYQC